MRSGVSVRQLGAGLPTHEDQSEMLNNTNERNQGNAEAVKSGSERQEATRVAYS